MPAKERESVVGSPVVSIIGAGVAGLACATELADRGVAVELLERSARLGESACSWMAGGMLAPWCERATTDEIVARLGEPSIDWWRRHYPGTVSQGSLVLTPPRDAADLTRFAARTERYEWIDGDRIASLEPDLAGRFRRALFFPDEAHLEPRKALTSLAAGLEARGVPIRFGIDGKPPEAASGFVVDCRGLAARNELPDLRGVRGEMLVVRTRDVSLSRPVRLLHPRIPLYIVPRGDGVFMIGATMIESEVTTRRQRAFGHGVSERGLHAAPGLPVRPRSSNWAPTCGRPFPTTCRASGAQAACCTPTDFSGMVSCSRRGWRVRLPMPCVLETRDADISERRHA